MLPLIVIGAPDVMRTALEPYAEVGHIEHHTTAEEAQYALADREAALPGDTEGLLDLPTSERWRVHAAYGPLAYGPLISAGTTGHWTTRLGHTGHTLILGWELDPEPSRPRRVIGHEVGGVNPNTMAWQAATVVGADVVVDVSLPAGLPFLTRYLEWKSGVIQA